ncbi:MAG: acylphosphatase [Archaeoglobaceae archaeon]
MNSRYVVIIEGRVQKGGFRSFIKRHALMRGLATLKIYPPTK